MISHCRILIDDSLPDLIGERLFISPIVLDVSHTITGEYLFISRLPTPVNIYYQYLFLLSAPVIGLIQVLDPSCLNAFHALHRADINKQLGEGAPLRELVARTPVPRK